MTRKRPRAARLALLAATLVAVAGCEGVQSALSPAGPQSAVIAREMVYLVTMASSVFAAVVIVLVIALVRRRDPAKRPQASDGKLALAVGAASVATAAVLIANVVIDMRTDHALGHLGHERPLTIEITARQWWWELVYRNDDPSRQLTTANELHIPAGEPVRVQLRAADVIHSFWVPRLVGKRDAIPGYTRDLFVQADHPGTYRGECAEFCGFQHAHMGLVVVAEPRADFERWYNAQLAPAAASAGEAAAQGAQVFATKACPACHSVRGTDAAGHAGPDLTHIASRSTLAAATLPNTRADLRSWVRDPHTAKPGTKMPPNALADGELEALLTYLEALR